MNEEQEAPKKSERNHAAHAVGHIFAIIWLGIVYYYLNKYYTNIPHITDTFAKVLHVFNISLIIAAASHLLQAFINNFRFRRLAHLIGNFVSLTVLSYFYTYFPLDFTGQVAYWIRFGTIFLMVCLVIAAVTELIRLINGPRKKD